MKNLTLLLLLWCFNGTTLGQDYKVFWELADNADSLVKSENYEEATDNYLRLFQLETPKGRTDFYRYPSAQAYAMSNNLDAAFEQLFYIADGKRHFLYFYIPTSEELNEDSLLVSLQKDKRWEKLLQLSDERNERLASQLDSTLMEEIETMKRDDQKYRGKFYETRAQYGDDSKQFKNLVKQQDKLYELNKNKLELIVNKHGWPGIDLIGSDASYSLFLVIQHQDVDVQLKYLPLIEEKHEQGNFIPGAFVMLKDRISMRQNHEQLYGTQFFYDKLEKKYFISPIANPELLNERRYQQGLVSYEKESGKPWDIEEYKRNLPALKEAYERNLPK